MGLETATFISGLTSTWPVASDKKNQGDDHLRLIKSVLQSTFPTASKPFYFPTTESISGTLTLDATDQNNMVLVDTTAGNVTVNLPSSLGASDKGWQCQILKISNDANAAIATPSAGTIASKSGATATIRVGIYCEPATFLWVGTGWVCYKFGPMVGSTENFNGASIPPGYLYENGAAFSNTAFAELFAVLGSSTLKEKRGRTDIGDGTGPGLVARTLGAAYGQDTYPLVTANLPPYTPSGSVSGGVVSFPNVDNTSVANGNAGAITTGTFGGDVRDLTGKLKPSQTPIVFAGNAQGGVSTPIDMLQPSIGVKKIVRAC